MRVDAGPAAMLDEKALRPRAMYTRSSTPGVVDSAATIFFDRLGVLRDRSFEKQKHRASGLNLVVTAIVL